MDLSDGLASSLDQLSKLNRIKYRVDLERIHVTKKLKDFCTDTGNTLRLLSHELEGSMSKVAALRVGLRTGFDVFVKHLLSRKGGSS
jgi:hypothetical protein